MARHKKNKDEKINLQVTWSR